MKSNKIQFLSKYRKNISLVDAKTLQENDIPVEWLEILNKGEPERREKTIEYWRSISSNELRNTISYLSDNLLDVELICYNDVYSVLYTVKVGEGEVDYFEGRIPTQNILNKELQKFWSETPQSIKDFYEKLHNGFYYFPSRAMGLVPLENVTFFGDDEWGIIEDLEAPLGIELDSTFGFFSTGMGGYVALDYSNDDKEKATIWFTDDHPKYNMNFWDVVDEWIVMGFE
ncbi:SMI1/KNR4 family protein [Listeria booriae]|uniref:SMI1/KNR4 family protein n=1 Tax=Listeria booriae TaxID=1552123 RepID=UPI001628D131|nr:SMI1/KNR4 family protein [Listeria booriae]MBC1524075.1 SMI1/KNR4 family protein [Listeria booriae]MBC1648739.1 SMI1/KNR4 family protein [Listeria booriae]MBC6164835.1 SMI1/KNR4 family protein [Listeria booriae]